MSTITLAALEATVRQRGDYLSSLTFTSAYIQGEIQAAWRELYELMDSVNEGWWDTEGTVTTTANQRYRALPTDCWRARGIDILDGSDYLELLQIGVGDRNRWGSSVGKPQAYRLSSRGIELFPTPGAAYTLRVTYTPICPTLADGRELYGWHEFLIEGALLRLYTREERDTSEIYRKLYDPQDGIKAQIVRAASKRKAQEPEYLMLRGDYPASYEDPY